jgi:hypothetical protein
LSKKQELKHRFQDKLDKSANILICPLEWGLGHAARMIPLAQRLQEMNNNIFVGSGSKHLALFNAEMNGITCVNFPGFRPRYSRYMPQYLVMLFQTPRLLYHIIREHIGLNKVIREYSIDIVISDNRFGLWNKKITSVYVTHMPLIPLPKSLKFLEFTGVLLHRFIIRKYKYCYIPDLPGEVNLSGRLSHSVKLPGNVGFIGILSRFISSDPIGSTDKKDILHNTVILSGPEPQRGMLKQKLVSLLKENEPVTFILEGNPGKSAEQIKSGNIICLSHLPASEMKKMVAGSESIISRSGYTSIMDLVSLNCSALLIPTPGQTEQEYLAEYLSGKGWFDTISQGSLNDKLKLRTISPAWPTSLIEESKILLNKALEELLE